MRDKRRWLERGKSLLILLLSLSALWLLSMTPLIRDSGILDVLHPAATPTTQPAAVSDGTACMGVQYDQAQADELFTLLGPLLGEALVTSAPPAALSEEGWQDYLTGAGIYFDFTGAIPLSALGGWLDQEARSPLTAAARRVLLAAGEEDTVLLCYEDADTGAFYACVTALTCSLHLEPAVAGVTDNGAQFAFENEQWAGVLQPYTMLTQEVSRQVYAATIPISPSGDVSALLDELSYAGHNHASVSGGELYLDGSDRLRVLSGGLVVFNAAQPGKYPIPMEGGSLTVAEAIEGARELAEATIGTRCGAAEVYLISARATREGYHIRFGYRLDGSTVWLYDEGWAAEFWITQGCITEFTLRFRTYADGGEQALLLSMEQAAAMIPDLSDQPRELLLQYRDQGGATVSPLWAAAE